MRIIKVKKGLAKILIVAMMGVTINVNVFGATIKTEMKLNDENRNKEPQVVKELKELRTENSTTYLLSDGSRRLDINAINTRYEEEGKYIEYNPNLTEITKEDTVKLTKISKNENLLEKKDIFNYKYANIAGDSKQYFPQELNEKNGIILEKNDVTIEFSPEVKQKNTFSIQEKKENTLDKEDIVYTQEQNHIDIKYTSCINGVKEEIILYEKPSSNIFGFYINSPNARWEKDSERNKICIIDNSSNETVAYIPEPNIKHANSDLVYGEVGYDLQTLETGKYFLQVIVNENYFDDPNIVYPVVIDPVVLWMDSALKSVMISNYTYLQNTNIQNSLYSFPVQNRAVSFPDVEYQCYIDTTGEPFWQPAEGYNDFYGASIQNANLKLVEYNNTYPKGTIEVRTPSSAWDTNTITWNNRPATDDKIWAQFSCSGAGTKHAVNLTEWAQAIADRKLNNYGLILTAKEEGTGSYFYGASVSNSSFMQLSIVYTPHTYLAEVNNYYDNGYKVRYSQPEFGGTSVENVIANHQNWVNSVFEEVFDLRIITTAPQLYTSTADACKAKQGLTVNLATIEQLCPGGVGHGIDALGIHSTSCTEIWGMHHAFIADHPSTETRCEVLWSGNKLDNNRCWTLGGGAIWPSSIITEIQNPNTRNETEKYILLHELGHAFGAPDEYCYNKELDKNEDCGALGCPKHHPERHGENCVMGNRIQNITSKNVNDLFCEYCRSNLPTGILYHLEKYNKIQGTE